MRQPLTRGSIYYADLTGAIGSEQAGIRPALIVQNDVGNAHSPTTQIIPLTTQHKKPKLPTHAKVSPACGLAGASIALAEQVRTIDRSRLGRYVGRIGDREQSAVNKAIASSFGLEVVA